MPSSLPPPPFSSVCFLVLLSLVACAAQAQPDGVYLSPPTAGESFRPRIAVVIGVFSLMFSLTFLLLIYAKFCHAANSGTDASDLFGADAADAHGRFLLPHHRFSGIDKKVIESLPLFRFSSLRGVRDGLECAVCLSRFDDAELLRLLPKCKHAFHLACVDRWLEAHSGCPLCRCKVKLEDAALFKYSASARFLFSSSDRLEASGRDLELFVEREPSHDGDLRGSSRFSIGGSFRKTDKNNEDEQDLPILEEGGGGGGRFLHKFKHKIIVSDVVFKSRWSDVNSSDLISLNTEMLSAFADVDWSLSAEPTGGARRPSGDEKASMDKIREEMEKKRMLDIKASQISKTEAPGITPSLPDLRSLIGSSSGNRSMSEITNVSRFRQAKESAAGNGATAAELGNEEEKVRRVWLPIARRTVQWFAGRERRSSESGSGSRESLQNTAGV